MSVTIKDVEHIAALARLELDATEKELYRGQLSAILDWMGELNELDTSGVEPLTRASGPERHETLRDDVPARFENRQALLSNAPMREYDFIKVKKVLE